LSIRQTGKQANREAKLTNNFFLTKRLDKIESYYNIEFDSVNIQPKPPPVNSDAAKAVYSLITSVCYYINNN